MWHRLEILISHGKLLLRVPCRIKISRAFVSLEAKCAYCSLWESATLPGFKFFAEVSVPTPTSHRFKAISSISAPASTLPAPVH